MSNVTSLSDRKNKKFLGVTKFNLIKLILFFQIVLLTLFLGAGYFLYSELQTLSTEVDNALTVIADIQSLLPKLEVAVDTVISLETAFQSLAGISDLLTILLDPLQGNS